MNIFALDESPKLAARYHCDQHVNKMILEGAQLLSTVARQLGADKPNLYKITHPAHPCTNWLHESYFNCEWLTHLVDELNMQRKYRWPERIDHVSTFVAIDALEQINEFMDREQVRSTQTPFHEVMPVECLMDTAVAGYRQYYRTKMTEWAIRGKTATWTKVGQPFWI